MHPPNHKTNKREKEPNMTAYFYEEEKQKFKVQDNEVLQKIR